MKRIFLIAALLLTSNTFADISRSYDSDMQFLMKVIEKEGVAGINVRIINKCEIESSSQTQINSMKITNLSTYYLGNIKSLNIKSTLDVGRGSSSPSQKFLAKKYPYSIEFDGNYSNVVLKSYYAEENLQYPQYNQPPSITDLTKFYFMFQNQAEAEKALPRIKNLVKLCS